MSEFASGEPCWVDVSCRDPEASRRFYSGVLGWSYRVDPDPAAGGYTYAYVGSRPVAGIAGQPSPPPATWTVYLATGDINRLAGLVTSNSGHIYYGPLDFPGKGTMIVGADPGGATIGFWEPDESWTLRTGGPGALYWAELNTWEPKAADHFFANLFGFRVDGGEDYTGYSMGIRTRLGRVRMGPGFPADTAPHWMPYFAAEPRTGVDAAVQRALDLGGQLVTNPYDSGFGRIAVVRDPAGAVFSLVDPTRALDDRSGRANNDDPYDD